MTQKKTNFLYLRSDPETLRKLKELTEVHDRNQSDLVRFLIRQDWDARFGTQQPAQQSTPQQ